MVAGKPQVPRGDVLKAPREVEVSKVTAAEWDKYRTRVSKTVQVARIDRLGVTTWRVTDHGEHKFYATEDEARGIAQDKQLRDIKRFMAGRL